MNSLAEPNQIPNLKNNVKNDYCYFMPLNMVGVLYNIRQPDARTENYPQLASDHHGWDAKLLVLLDPPLPPPRSRISEYSPHHLILTSQDHRLISPFIRVWVLQFQACSHPLQSLQWFRQGQSLSFLFCNMCRISALLTWQGGSEDPSQKLEFRGLLPMLEF